MVLEALNCSAYNLSLLQPVFHAGDVWSTASSAGPHLQVTHAALPGSDWSIDTAALCPWPRSVGTMLAQRCLAQPPTAQVTFSSGAELAAPHRVARSWHAVSESSRSATLQGQATQKPPLWGLPSAGDDGKGPAWSREVISWSGLGEQGRARCTLAAQGLGPGPTLDTAAKRGRGFPQLLLPQQVLLCL